VILDLTQKTRTLEPDKADSVTTMFSWINPNEATNISYTGWTYSPEKNDDNNVTLEDGNSQQFYNLARAVDFSDLYNTEWRVCFSSY